MKIKLSVRFVGAVISAVGLVVANHKDPVVWQTAVGLVFAALAEGPVKKPKGEPTDASDDE